MYDKLVTKDDAIYTKVSNTKEILSEIRNNSGKQNLKIKIWDFYKAKI